MKFLYVDLSEQKKLRELVASKKKIKAIKYLRDLTGAGLRESKEALEHMLGNQTFTGSSSPAAMIRSPWRVDSIKMMSPSGKLVKLSISDLELNFLQESSTIGIDEVASLLDLTEFIKTWQQGKKGK
jgi:hypothetical protein|tara:strand:- start:3226 stop:3606 length:381 start_codon:yes stop_codon:yes gene_type:complete